MKISKHFSREEFACKCGCGFATVDVRLLELLESVREHFNRPVTINSGCRCPGYNERVGGVMTSKHIEGIAADITVKGIEPGEVYEYLTNHIGGYWAGLGEYDTFVHVDARSLPARWEG